MHQGCPSWYRLRCEDRRQNRTVHDERPQQGSRFQTYRSGILSNCNGRQLDHGVLAVGYTSQYFKVKNSWGKSWGEKGYIRLSTNGNQCGMLNEGIYPVVRGEAEVV